jgi:predicted Holliday junction resolvase-like endonuclease
MKDGNGDMISIVPVEVKKGQERLTREVGLIKKAVEEKRVSFRTIFQKDERVGENLG